MKIISLGTNCEVSFFIEQFLSKAIDSYLFSWARTNFDPIRSLDVLENPTDLLNSEWELLPWGMVRNIKYNIGFHIKKTKDEVFNADGSINGPVYEEALSELFSRLKHLIQKTENLFNGENKEDILFVCKIDGDYEENLYYLVKLCDILKKKSKNAQVDYAILAIVNGKNMGEQLQQLKISANLIIRHVDFFQYPPIRRRGGFDLLNWESAFSAGIKYLEHIKLSKYDKNLVGELSKNDWLIVKSGDATGEFNVKERSICCKSEENCYFGISYDIPNPSLYAGKKLRLELEISDISSIRKDVGYFQIWEHSIEEPKFPTSAYLEHIYYDKNRYYTEYTVPSNLSRLRVVIQTKNGSFRIHNISAYVSIIN